MNSYDTDPLFDAMAATVALSDIGLIRKSAIDSNEQPQGVRFNSWRTRTLWSTFWTRSAIHKRRSARTITMALS